VSDDAARPYAPERAWVDYDHGPFRDMPAEAWSEDLFRTNEVVSAVVSDRCLGILQALGVPAPSHLELLADDLALATGVTEERAPAFHWLFRRLFAAGLLVGDPGEEIHDVLEPPWTEASLAAAVAEVAPRAGTTFDLIDRVAEAYPGWLRGEVDASRVLFDRRGLELWAGYFTNANLAYASANVLAAELAARATEGREGLRVLEAGGGLGSAAEALLGRVGPRVAAYRFTEVSPALLAKGRRAAAAAAAASAPAAALESGRLDLGRDLAEQGVAPGSVDLAFAVNVLHATPDLVGALRRLREALAEGGVLVLGEGLRRAVDLPSAHELVFQMTPEFQAAAPEAGVRTGGGFVAWDAWPVALERAGLGRVETLPADPGAVLAEYPGFGGLALAAWGE